MQKCRLDLNWVAQKAVSDFITQQQEMERRRLVVLGQQVIDLSTYARCTYDCIKQSFHHEIARRIREEHQEEVGQVKVKRHPNISRLTRLAVVSWSTMANFSSCTMI
jgi:hypothetical protein